MHSSTFRNVPKSVDFHQTDGCYCDLFAPTCHFTFLIPRRLTHKRSDKQQTYISHTILPPNSSKSWIHSKPKKIRFETSSAIHLHRDGISDTTEYSQGTTRWYRIPTSNYQTISNWHSSFGTNFPFSFGQTHCCRRLSCSRQPSFTTTTNMSVISLETSYFTTGSSSSDNQYDLISFEMVDGHQSLRSGNVHHSSRSECIPYHGCQPLWMGSSSQTDKTILS